LKRIIFSLNVHALYKFIRKFREIKLWSDISLRIYKFRFSFT